MTTLLLCLLLIILVVFSAFFSSSETAFLSLSNMKIRQIVKAKVKKANSIKKLKSNINQLLSTILIGNNFVTALASSIATAFALSLVGKNGTGIATIIMTILIILFGEILPKTIATYQPLKVAQITATPLRFLEIIFFPLIWFFTKLADGITAFFSGNLPDDSRSYEKYINVLERRKVKGSAQISNM